jgi:hypothetical protein
MRTGTAQLPLHHGAAPRWLFERMVLLSRQVVLALVEEFGPREVLLRLADPSWFQAFGCVLGFDWHSSGLTTTVCGALKEALRPLGRDAGVFVAGGKGRTSRKTPTELEEYGQRLGLDAAPLIYASRMSAKVDSAAVQDGYELYHHTFVFIQDGDWCVIQQGMNASTRYARRYHWLSDTVRDFVDEPHHAVCAEATGPTLNLVAHESAGARAAAAQIASQRPTSVLRDVQRLHEDLHLPARHHLLLSDIDPKRIEQVLLRTYEHQPPDFEQLLGLPGVGAKTVRALALLAELIYGERASVRDPARYTFAHGGKDGHPYPVDRETYDRSIEVLRRAVERARLGQRDRVEALRRLTQLTRGAA